MPGFGPFVAIPSSRPSMRIGNPTPSPQVPRRKPEDGSRPGAADGPCRPDGASGTIARAGIG